MNDPNDIRALKQLERELERARRRTSQPRRRRPRLALIATSLAAAIAAPALATSEVFDFGGNTPEAGEPGGPPRVVTEARDPTVNVIATIYEPEGEQLLRDLVEPYGFTVRIERRPVAGDAVGRIFGVQYPRRARFNASEDLVLDRRSSGTIIVSIGRAATPDDASVGTSGLSLYEVLPRVEAAVSRTDPRATLNRLREMGFAVTVKLVIDNPNRSRGAKTGVKDVALPPEGTVVLSILNADGSNTATPKTRSLIMEVAPRGSDVVRGHP